jgi:hypothetical protein
MIFVHGLAVACHGGFPPSAGPSAPFDYTYGETAWLVRDHDASNAYDDGTLYFPNSLGAGYPPDYLQADAAQKPTIETHVASGKKWLKSDQSSDTATGTAHLTSASNTHIVNTDVFVVLKRLPSPNKSRMWAGKIGQVYNAVGFWVGGMLKAWNFVASRADGTVVTPEDTWMVLHLATSNAGVYSFYRVYDSAGVLIDERHDDTKSWGGDYEALMAGVEGTATPLLSGHCGIARMLVFDNSTTVPTESQRTDIIEALCLEHAAPMNL